MILKDFQDQQLIIIKAEDNIGDLVELVFFSTALPDANIDLINDLRQLASNRRSEGYYMDNGHWLR